MSILHLILALLISLPILENLISIQKQNLEIKIEKSVCAHFKQSLDLLLKQ